MMMDPPAFLTPHTRRELKSARQNQNRINLLAGFKIMQHGQPVPDASEQE
ncbi:hypothetical protein [Pseudomonas graminis]|uniref:Uncharacterized protein n=1 Tax=Pseudomonas graminis TaxID=158627 RepID=A0A1I0I136_9PSED|nr:hypothetical protein [Pseudomonas graminis]SET90152.1 hypothetical protein SAMN05216197_13161 [Pseudomonas graminis]